MKISANIVAFVLVTAPFTPAVGIVSPAVQRSVSQGGDTIETAAEVTVPFVGAGTTAGYSDDYDEECWHSSHAPDVVYTFVAGEDRVICVDLWGSQYDTKVYAYDEDLNVLACNDDFYEGEFYGISRLQWIEVRAGVRYYIVVDGYSTHSYGNYQIEILYNELPVPPEFEAEGEPALYQGYLDNYNNGCANQPPLFQPLAGDSDGRLAFLGQTGWVFGSTPNDFDCYEVRVGATGTVNLEIWSQLKTNVFEIAPLDCAQAVVTEETWAISNRGTMMAISGPPGSVHWLGVLPWSNEVPPWYTAPEYAYLLEFTGLETGTTPSERISYGALKCLFR
jgi:hypothetical protein